MNRLAELTEAVTALYDALEQIDGEIGSHAVRQISLSISNIEDVLERERLSNEAY
jgi:hypothetical protein